MAKTLRVRAASPELKVPREGTPRRHITGTEPETVPSTPYYRRRIESGELVEVIS